MPNSSFSRTMAERGFTRFVLLRPREAPSPSSFANELREHWSHVLQVDDPLGALAELCVLERAEQPRRSYGLPPRERVALIVLERAAWHDLSDLLRTIRERLPEVSVWIHTGELILEVTDPAQPSNGSEASPSPSSATHASKSGFGALKLAGSWTEETPRSDEEPAANAENTPPTPPEPARTEPDLAESEFEADLKDPTPRTVSPEELEMLLDRDDEDEQPSPGPDEDFHP